MSVRNFQVIVRWEPLLESEDEGCYVVVLRNSSFKEKIVGQDVSDAEAREIAESWAKFLGLPSYTIII